MGRTEQATVSGGAGTRSPRARRRLYVSVTVKFLVAQGLSAGWLGVSIWLSLPWLRELAATVTVVPASRSSR